MNKTNVSVFDLLKQGTSFKKNKDHHVFKNKDQPKTNTKNKSKDDSLRLQANKTKYGMQDSESEADEDGIFYPEVLNDKVKGNLFDHNTTDNVVKLQNQRRDRMNKLVKKLRIKFEGEDVPFPVSNFSKMRKRFNLNESLIQNMKKAGYENPTPVQMQSIPILMKNRNLLSVAPTGSGKTLAYLIPLYCQLQKHKSGGCRAVIFAPTVELGDQILREFLFFNINIKDYLKVKFLHKINDDKKGFKEQLEHIDIIITTPSKFIKLFENSQEKIQTIKYAIFDEADKYFELGFLDEVNTILEFLKVNSSIVYGWFSATINTVIEDILRNFLTDAIKVMIGGRNNVLASIEQKLVYAGSEFGKLVEIRRMISEGGIDPPVLIFMQSKERAIELYDELKDEKINLGIIHADKTYEEREDAVLRFRLGEIWVLITTELMARGIDFKGVNLVINYDFPTSIVSYVHRVGRTGRANRKGTAITFFTDLDKPLLKSLGNTLKTSGLDVPDWILNLKKAGKDYRKKIEQHPVRREHISTTIEKQTDPKFKREIQKVDKIWQKTIKKLKINPESVSNGDDDWKTIEKDVDDDNTKWTEVAQEEDYEE